MSSLLRDVAALIRGTSQDDLAAIATARAVLRHIGAAARLEGGTWTGQWADRAAAAEVEP